MYSSKLQDLFVVLENNSVREAVVMTDNGYYALNGDGYSKIDQLPPQAKNVLPLGFKTKVITEARCDGEHIAIKLEDGSFITMGWTLDTQTGEGYRDVFFYSKEEIDDDFREFYDQLDVCNK